MQMYQSTVITSWNEQASVLQDFVATQCSPQFLQSLGLRSGKLIEPHEKLLNWLGRGPVRGDFL